LRKLFGDLLAFAYHCFDRIVILGYLPLLTCPENIVHFVRGVHGGVAITKEVLRQRTIEYSIEPKHEEVTAMPPPRHHYPAPPPLRLRGNPPYPAY